MQSLSGCLVWVRLDAECLVDGEQFEQKGEVAVVCIELTDDVFADEARMGS
jgi:hypothetical protein